MLTGAPNVDAGPGVSGPLSRPGVVAASRHESHAGHRGTDVLRTARVMFWVTNVPVTS